MVNSRHRLRAKLPFSLCCQLAPGGLPNVQHPREMEVKTDTPKSVRLSVQRSTPNYTFARPGNCLIPTVKASCRRCAFVRTGKCSIPAVKHSFRRCAFQKREVFSADCMLVRPNKTNKWWSKESWVNRSPWNKELVSQWRVAVDPTNYAGMLPLDFQSITQLSWQYTLTHQSHRLPQHWNISCRPSINHTVVQTIRIGKLPIDLQSITQLST